MASDGTPDEIDKLTSGTLNLGLLDRSTSALEEITAGKGNSPFGSVSAPDEPKTTLDGGRQKPEGFVSSFSAGASGNNSPAGSEHSESDDPPLQQTEATSIFRFGAASRKRGAEGDLEYEMTGLEHKFGEVYKGMELDDVLILINDTVAGIGTDIRADRTAREEAMNRIQRELDDLSTFKRDIIKKLDDTLAGVLQCATKTEGGLDQMVRSLQQHTAAINAKVSGISTVAGSLQSQMTAGSRSLHEPSVGPVSLISPGLGVTSPPLHPAPTQPHREPDQPRSRAEVVDLLRNSGVDLLPHFTALNTPQGRAALWNKYTAPK